MFNSLLEHCPSFHLYIICLDQKLFSYFIKKKFDNITAIPLKEVEAHYEELVHIKQNRDYNEYIFTLSPIVALYILEKYSCVEMITTLDADIYFFSDPSVLFKDADSFSIAITPHKFKRQLKPLEKYGKYNVSFQTFKNNRIGIECLQKWKKDCINWCHDRYEDGKFADQKYLDNWPYLYPELKEYGNGSGIAPWNICNKDLYINQEGHLYIKKDRLIYYHFHGVRNITQNLYSLGLYNYHVFKKNRIIKYIYLDYIKNISCLYQRNISNSIGRTTHPNFGKIIYTLFIADLFILKKGHLFSISNFNFVIRFYSKLKSILWLT